MFRKVSLSILLLFVAWPHTQAQSTKVTTAMVEYQSGDLVKALEIFDEALDRSNEMADKYWAKGYFYRAKTKYDILARSPHTPEYEQLASNISASDIYTDVENCRDYDKTDKLKRQIDDFLPGVRLLLLQDAISSLSDGNYLKAKHNARKAADIEREYLALDILAQAEMYFQEYRSAGSHFQEAIELYNASPPDKPDLLTGYMYYRLSLIPAYYTPEPGQADIDKAFSTAAAGLEFTDREWRRILAKKETYSESSWNAAETSYRSVTQDLTLLELDLYNLYEKNEEAKRAKFEAAMEQYPDNANILLAYAATFEQSDPERAAKLYLKATELAPADPTGHFNAGSMYFNKGADLFTAASMESDEDKYAALREEGKTWFLTSKPHFEKALELDPSDLNSIAALKQVTMQLELMDDYKRYVEMEKALQN